MRNQALTSERKSIRVLLALWRVPVLRYVLRATHFLEFVKVLETRKAYTLLKPRNGEMICDVACGIGLHVSKLAKRGCSGLGIDVDPSRIRIAELMNHGLGCQFQIAEAGSLPYRSGVFHKVVCFSALEHFNDDRKALAEISRILDRSGILVASCDSFTYSQDPGIKHIHSWANDVKRYYSVRSLEVELQRVGLNIQESAFYVNSFVSAFFFRVQILFPLLSRLLFPISMPLSVIAERITGRTDGGYFVCVKATKSSDALDILRGSIPNQH